MERGVPNLRAPSRNGVQRPIRDGRARDEGGPTGTARSGARAPGGPKGGCGGVVDVTSPRQPAGESTGLKQNCHCRRRHFAPATCWRIDSFRPNNQQENQRPLPPRPWEGALMGLLRYGVSSATCGCKSVVMARGAERERKALRLGGQSCSWPSRSNGV